MSINLVQNLDVEVDSKKLLKQYLKLALPTVLDSNEEIAIKVIDHNDKYKKLYYPPDIYNETNFLPVLLIEGWYKSKEKSYFHGYKPWKLFNGEDTLKDTIDYIMTFLDTSELSERFLKDCGTGYNDGFNCDDGTVHIGYKLISNHTFPKSLTLSMVHIYYGK